MKIDNNILVETIRKKLEDYVVSNRIKSLVLGVSGGIDSALVAALAEPVAKKLGIPLIGRSISIETNKPDEKQRADHVGNLFCTDFKSVDLTWSFQDLSEDFDKLEDFDEKAIKSKNIRLGNIKARMRMIYLYNLAGATKGMVLSTDNLTEYNLGFWTLCGDVGDYAPIQQLWKTEVYNLTEWIANEELDNMQQVLMNCVEADATDGLGISNTDLDQLMPDFKGTSREGYGIVDERLRDYMTFGTADLDDPVIARHTMTEFKRKWPIIIPRNELMENQK